MSIWDGLLAFVLGGCGWSFSEYAIHRFRGHGKKNGSLFQREHRRHHAEAHYFAPASLKVRMAILPLLVIGSLGSLLVNPVIGVSFALGFGLTYAAYEYTHWRLHARAPRGPWGRLLRRHHFAHHFHDAKSNHGVTSPFWDLLFGSYVKVAHVRVPARHTMIWLADPETGRVHEDHEAEYTILQRRSSR